MYALSILQSKIPVILDEFRGMDKIDPFLNFSGSENQEFDFPGFKKTGKIKRKNGPNYFKENYLEK